MYCMYAQPASQLQEGRLWGRIVAVKCCMYTHLVCVVSLASDLHISVVALRVVNDKTISRDDPLQRGR